jgi:hypothetical protein
MISHSELEKLAKARLEEANVLHDAKRWDGAVYICGYAIELALKSVIAKDRLNGFPTDDAEFDLAKNCKTHELPKLLAHSLRDVALQGDKDFWVAWGEVKEWQSEFRYRPLGTADESASRKILEASHVIMTKLGIV